MKKSVTKMSLSGKSKIESEKIISLFLKVLNNKIAVERLGIYFNCRAETFLIEINLWQISCRFEFETSDESEYRVIHDQLCGCKNILSEDGCREFYEDLLSCYAEMHNIESGQ